MTSRSWWVHRFGGPVTDRTVTPGDSTEVCDDLVGIARSLRPVVGRGLVHVDD